MRFARLGNDRVILKGVAGWSWLVGEIVSGTVNLRGAACTTVTGLHDVEGVTDKHDERVVWAQAVCAACPVREPCAEWSSSHGSQFRPAGVVGGKYRRPPRIGGDDQ